MLLFLLYNKSAYVTIPPLWSSEVLRNGSFTSNIMNTLPDFTFPDKIANRRNDALHVFQV